MILANRNGLKNTRNMLRVFGGLNETYSCTEAEYSAGINFSARNFPALSTRLPRRKLRETAELNGMYHLNGLLMVCGTRLIYTPDDPDELEVTLENAVEDGKKALVGIGTKILIFPDKLAFDTVSREVSALGAVWSGANASMEFAPCDAEGRVYEVSGSGPSEPENPKDGQLFLRVEDPEKPWSSESTLEVYSEASGNWSAVVTGVLLAFNLPASIPWWIVVIGAFVAIAIAKMTFGGLGKNPFNPALVGRVFLLIAYPVQMTSFPMPANGAFDALSGATPLAAVKHGVAPDVLGVQELLLGNMPGSLGEVAALALICGFVYLLWRRVITWQIPVSVLGTMAVFAFVVALASGSTGPVLWQFPLFHVLAGGALLGAIFMATDYSTSPMTVRGGVIFGIGIGAITMCIRLWGAYPEGMSFAILIMNACVPLINKYVKPKRFGVK